MAAESQGRGRTPPDTRIYAIGDVHGRKDLLDRLLRMIAADAKSSAAGHKLVVFLGDYVDRGPESRQVIETVMAGPPPGTDWAGFRWRPILGNHEQMMLRFLDDLEVAAAWLSPSNGGLETVRSYVGELPQPSGLHALQAALLKAVPAEHRRFLAGLPACHEEGGYFFVHAGVRPTVPLAHQQRQDMLWIRGEFLGSSVDYGKIVVHGHTITMAPEDKPNRIGVDTGAFFTNRLTAMVAEGDWHGFLST